MLKALSNFNVPYNAMVKDLGIETDAVLPIASLFGYTKSGKTESLCMLASASFRKSLKQLAGPGSTTPYPMNTLIDPNTLNAAIAIYLKNHQMVKNYQKRNLKIALVKEMKNYLSSRPKTDTALKEFISKAVEDRMRDGDKKFRVDKLLCYPTTEDKYREYFAELIGAMVSGINKQFKESYFQLKGEDSNEADMLLDTYVDQILSAQDETIENLAVMIQAEAKICLENAGFIQGSQEGCYVATELSDVKCGDCVAAITNSTKTNIQSAACAIDAVFIRVPGEGIEQEIEGRRKIGPYIVCDVVGVGNDGRKYHDENVRSALLESIQYDVLIYVTPCGTAQVTDEENFKDIFSTMRPAKLVVLRTFMDTDELFSSDEDEEYTHPPVESVKKMISERKKEILKVVKGTYTSDSHVILPEYSDIVCVANKGYNIIGENGKAELGDNSYHILRNAISLGYAAVHKRIPATGIQPGQVFMKPINDITQRVGKTIMEVENIINAELENMKAHANKYHHWTLDAVLNQYLYGREHVSNCQVWEDVIIKTYSNIARVLFDSYGGFKFEECFSIKDADAASRIHNEFNANLRTELRRAAWILILYTKYDDSHGNIKSECYKKIIELINTPKYNKWKILNDLQSSMLNVVVDKEHMEWLIKDSLKNACYATYERILY